MKNVIHIINLIHYTKSIGMKSFALCFLIYLFVFNSSFGQVRIGITSGTGLSRITIKDERVFGEVGSDYYSSNATTRNSWTYYGGLMAAFKVSNALEFRTKLLANSKSWKERAVYKISSSAAGSNPKDSTASQRTYRISYLELPMNLIFLSPLGKSKILFGVGPYISYALGGKFKMDIEHTIMANSTDSLAFINFTSEEIRGTAYKGNRFDFGASIVAGIELRNGVVFDLNYTVGTKDILQDRYFVFPNRWRVFTVGIGYFFYNGTKNKSNF